ncbi:hypothetical protein SH661x_004542 [Planctomicrobium sp. SH661]|uniref:hypothetical protein n=1 Tax=Planctomicrobium sp. SH661 TaxID=3448124 RepID=UPI003F5BEFF6
MFGLTWYQLFNDVEAVLWGIASITVLFKTPCSTPQQVWAARLGALSFFVFGITDLIEAAHETWIPLWLWGLKCLCGVGLISSRYMWKGWNRFRWTDREFLFGVGCLLAVLVLIKLQHSSLNQSLPSSQTRKLNPLEHRERTTAIRLAE